MNKTRLKVTFLNDNMGPYHFYRLSCANKLLEANAIQFSAKDHTNLWDNSQFKKHNVITLFQDKPITEIPSKEIKQKIFLTLEELNPDVVFISGWDAMASLYSLQWCVENNKPTVIISESQKHDFKRNSFKEMYKKFILKYIDSAFVGGIKQKEYLRDLGVNENNIFEGCDIVDNDHFKKISSKKPNFHLPDNYFFTSCRFVEKKNLFFLLDAFKIFNSKNDLFHLIIAGDGPLRSKLEQHAKSLNIEEKVIFIGYIEYDDIPFFYQNAKCFILPSLVEQWGLVINESLAAGTPVLVSERAGSAPNLVVNKDSGFTFNPLEKEDLVNKMLEISNLVLGDIDYKKICQSAISKWSNEKYADNAFRASIKAQIEYGKRKKTNIFYLNLLIWLRSILTNRI